MQCLLVRRGRYQRVGGGGGGGGGGGFPAILSRPGKEKYGEDLNFELSCTESHDLVIVSSKLCHFHPPAGLASRTRINVTEDGVFDFQVLLLSKEKGKLSTVRLQS